MEVICGVYTAKKTTIPDPFAHIQKESQPDHLYYWPNDEVLIPNICIFWCPTIGMNMRTKEVGYLNLSDFDVKITEEEDGEIGNVTEAIFAHGVAVQVSEHHTMVGWIQYSMGHLVWIAPGPFIPASESYDTADKPYIKVYNLATSDVGYVPWDDFAWFPNAEGLHRRPRQTPVPITNRIFYRFKGMSGYEAMVEGYPLSNLVVSGEPRLDKWYHGLRVDDGMVGWWQRVRVLPHATQKDMQLRIERGIQHRLPEGTELETLEDYIPQVAMSECLDRIDPFGSDFVFNEMGQPPNEAVNPSIANEASVGAFHSTDAADFRPVSNQLFDPEFISPTSFIAAAASPPTLPQVALSECLNRLDASSTHENPSESVPPPARMLTPPDFGDILDFQIYKY